MYLKHLYHLIILCPETANSWLFIIKVFMPRLRKIITTIPCMFHSLIVLAPIVREGFNSAALDQMPIISVQHYLMLYLLELQQKSHWFHMTQHRDSAFQPQHACFLQGNIAFKGANLNDLKYKEVETRKTSRVSQSSRIDEPASSSKPKH